MIKIRPHHILCMKAYVGKGYSEDFNINMKEIINELRDDSQTIQIVFGLDDICSKCPYNLGNGLCKSQDKVEKIDSKIIDYFNIKEDKYVYKELKEKIYKKMNEDMFIDICSNCSWYTVTNCKELNLNF